LIEEEERRERERARAKKKRKLQQRWSDVGNLCTIPKILFLSYTSYEGQVFLGSTWKI
jgi:hypothetical protein